MVTFFNLRTLMEIQFCFRTVGSGTKYHVLYYMWTVCFFFPPEDWRRNEVAYVLGIEWDVL